MGVEAAWVEDRVVDRLEEAAVPELVERLEWARANLATARRELEAVRAERDRLDAELWLARRWMRLLAEEVEALSC